MPFPNIFSAETVQSLENRINKIDPALPPQWGKMNAAQMIAHLNVMYEMAYEDNHPNPNPFMRFILKAFVKKMVVGDTPYPKNGQTAPAFVIKDARDFEAEKKRLIQYLHKSLDIGRAAHEQRLYRSFGKMTSEEWNTMFYKHIDHHLTQFAV